jgi:hypothetical protein
MRMFSRAIFCRAQSWRALLGITAARVAVSLADVNGAPALAAGMAASAGASARPAHRTAGDNRTAGCRILQHGRPAARRRRRPGEQCVGGRLRGYRLKHRGTDAALERVHVVAGHQPAELTGPGELAAITVVSAKDAWAVGYTGADGLLPGHGHSHLALGVGDQVSG